MTINKQRVNAKGRNTYNVGAFSSVPIDMQKSAAFQSLSPSALRVLLWALNKNYKAATKIDASGKQSFKLTNSEALKDYGLNSATFTNAKKQLEEKGFLEWVKRGGLKGCNGVCSTFCLSGKWKTWIAPPKKTSANLLKARSALKRKKDNKEDAEGVW